jgi:hypothetical protein
MEVSYKILIFEIKHNVYLFSVIYFQPACYKISPGASELDGFFGTTQATENGYEIQNMEC